MTRDEFYNRYREARKAAGFVAEFWKRLSRTKGDLSMFQTTRACPGFTFIRLHNDPLRHGTSVKIGNRMKWMPTPRLPA